MFNPPSDAFPAKSGPVGKVDARTTNVVRAEDEKHIIRGSDDDFAFAGVGTVEKVPTVSR